MNERIYLDYAAAAPLHPEVKKEMMRAEKFWANASSLHKEGRAARAIIDNARLSIAQSIGANTDEIIFTSGATESNFLALRGVLEYLRIKGQKPHLVISKIEHPSIYEQARFLESMGLEVSWVEVGKDGLVNVASLENSIKENTALVSIIYANHETGTVQNIAELAGVVKAKNPKTLFHTDAAQGLGWLDVNVGELNADLITGSGYKLYGPKGVGFLYVNSRANLSPQFVGFQEWGKRAGTESTILIAGLAKALKLSKDWPREKVRKLRNDLLKKIQASVPGVILNSQSSSSVPHIAHFSFEGIDPQILNIALDRAGLASSPGSACSTGAVKVSPVLEALGIDIKKYSGSLRLSLGIDTEDREVAEAASIVKNEINKLRGG
ncbi:MAG: hypothetical protein A3J48_01665 [Candidatus Doudnabacteria bacterium RIFCSPHIGHO2_02_FULL_46_11]|uniref:Aminotransferase class V domain-containing protein n=1 Tax=Candidatus Doudnabacteria bacterium RIFCSPHIGHO2_02_FULL_46_11 TaxID=1817832 RepID=A0A1F5PAE1_9BACT|nr:MAG: hypothetical protein A3J48_01665 [Candidatus Doudnabacteria bacterium RIFCSPHIGHO2_02_FULL_46_11]